MDIALRRIKEMMYHHEIVPGQKLPYQELARSLGMSITPIIQALNRLQLANIVYSEPNKGFYVGEAHPEEAADLFTALEALETYLVPTIIANLTKKKLDRIEVAMKEYVAAASAPEYRRLLMIKDTNFHLRITECAENKVIYTLCHRILEQIYLKYRPEYMREERITEAAQEHKELLKALREKDKKKLTRLLKQHIRKGRDHVVGSLEQEKSLEL